LEQLKVSHLRGASGYILVADGCRASTLEKAVELQARIAEIQGPLPFVMVLNKADLRAQWEIDKSKVAGNGWATFETSAQTGAGVEEMFQGIAEMLLADEVGG